MSCKTIIERCLLNKAITQEEHDKLMRKITAQQWIPCSEPPEDGKPVLVTIWKDTIVIGYFYKMPDGKTVFRSEDFDLYNSELEEISAWMPLPEPYKEEEG